ncbi:hypothetical protein ECEC1736_2808, partial [Escherichia coli EC1736]
MTFPRL